MTILTAFGRSAAIRRRHTGSFIVHLLSWTSFPVLVLATWMLLEMAAFLRPSLRESRGWILPAWFLRPIAAWSVLNVVYRYFAEYGSGDRTTFPFYFSAWRPKESWSQLANRLVHSEDFWMWSFAILLLTVLLLLVCRWILEGNLTRTKVGVALGYLMILNFVMPLAFDALPEGVIDPWERKGSFLNSWFESGNTMLYAMPSINSKGDFLRRFEKIQPDLSMSIHACTHPPGASLALYWAGKMLGAQKRVARDRLRYQLANTLMAALSVLSIYLLGRLVSGVPLTGLLAAALWVAKPATMAYSAFAPDVAQNIFMILALAFSWRVVTFPTRPWFSMLILGCVFYVVSMLNFNWPLFVGIFGGFLLIHAWLVSRKFADWFLRGAVPVTVSLVLLVWTCIDYGLNYIAIFRYALDFHKDYYVGLKEPYLWVCGLLGGPLDLYILSGSFCAYVFWRQFPKDWRLRPLPLPVLFTIVLLGAQIAAILLVSRALTMEQSRIWAWLTAMPLVLVAGYLQDFRSSRFYILAALALSIIQYYAMRVVLTSCG